MPFSRMVSVLSMSMRGEIKSQPPTSHHSPVGRLERSKYEEMAPNKSANTGSCLKREGGEGEAIHICALIFLMSETDILGEPRVLLGAQRNMAAWSRSMLMRAQDVRGNDSHEEDTQEKCSGVGP